MVLISWLQAHHALNVECIQYAGVALPHHCKACRVDPFDPNSPLKKMAVKHFPSDMFFVLRVVQLLRGLSTHMGVDNFSTAHQWRPFADDTLRQHGMLAAGKRWWQDSTFTGEA